MLEEIKKQIGESKVLTEKSKETYLRLIQFMSDEDLADLSRILKEASDGLEEVAQEIKREESEFYQGVVQEIKESYKKAYKEAEKEDEDADEAKAEKLLEDNQK